jgi:hypothetical protein
MAKATGLDHFVLAVEDLDAGKSAFEKLGFTVTPRGVHVGWGTANYLIVLENQYIELVGSFGVGPDHDLWHELARKSEGLWQLGFKPGAGGARALCEQLRALGVPMEEPYDYARPIHLEGTDASVEFVVCYVGDALSLPAASFICEQKTPQLVWRPEWMHHANGCRRILRVDIAADNPADAAARYSRFVHGALTERGEAASIATSNTEIRLLPKTTGDKAPGLGLWIEVRDLTTSKNVLAHAGVTAKAANEDHLSFPREVSCGIPLTLVNKKYK